MATIYAQAGRGETGKTLWSKGRNPTADRRGRLQRIWPARCEVASANLAELLVHIRQAAATGREPLLADFRERCVVGVTDIGERRFHGLADQLVRVHFRESVIGDEPGDEVRLGDAECVLQWARGSGGHDVRVGFESRPRRRVALDKVDSNNGVHGALDGNTARF